MSNFSFSHGVFKRLVLQTRKNQGLFGKGLRETIMVHQMCTDTCSFFKHSFGHTCTMLSSISDSIFCEKGGDNKAWEEQKKQLLADMESERQHHQKLVKEHNRLLQRFENMQGEMQVILAIAWV